MGSGTGPPGLRAASCWLSGAEQDSVDSGTRKKSQGTVTFQGKSETYRTVLSWNLTLNTPGLEKDVFG